MKLILSIFLVTMFYSQLKSGLPFLTHSTSAKRISQGFAHGAYDNFFPAEFNPAFLGLTDKNSISINQQTWLNDISFLGIVSNFSIGSMNFSGNVKYHSIKDIPVRSETASQESLGSFDNYTAIASLSTSIKLYENLHVGLSYKLIREKLYLNIVNGSSYDFGFLYNTNFIDVYGSYENLGDTETNEVSYIKFPKLISFGVRKSFDQLNVGFEIQNLDKMTTEHFFLESELNKYISLSAGYVFGSDVQSWSGGVEFTFRKIHLLFSYAEHKLFNEYKLIQFSLDI